MGGDAESTRTDDDVGIRELAPSRNGQRRVRETDGTRLHNVVLSDVHSPAARANYRAFAPRLKLGRRWSRCRPNQLSPPASCRPSDQAVQTDKEQAQREQNDWLTWLTSLRDPTECAGSNDAAPRYSSVGVGSSGAPNQAQEQRINFLVVT